MQRSLDLYDHLLNSSRYNPSIVPSCGSNDKVTVRIGMALRDIVEVKEKQQIIRTKVDSSKMGRLFDAMGSSSFSKPDRVKVVWDTLQYFQG